jgi:tetratricopeptide (TPR) repeat protein
MKRVFLALAFVLAAPFAHADTPPTRWERAKDPDSTDTFRAHRRARALVYEAKTLERSGFRSDLRDPMGRRYLEEAIETLEAAGGEKSKDIRIRFDLGEVHFDLKDHKRSAEILKAALNDEPNHSASEEAWLTLAFACGHMGDHPCERKAYVEFLRRVNEEPLRVTPTLNLAETEMHLGHLKEAIEGYREALRLSGRTNHRETAPLAVWGLAVALDRSGDRAGAEKEARFAMELETSVGRPRILTSPDVFFVPAYEVDYYHGLGAYALGAVAKTASEAVGHFRNAENSFARYVRVANTGDPWVEMAKARLAMAKAEREKAEVRLRKEPRPKFIEGTDVDL